jgi:hypothetical protein
MTRAYEPKRTCPRHVKGAFDHELSQGGSRDQISRALLWEASNSSTKTEEGQAFGSASVSG